MTPNWICQEEMMDGGGAEEWQLSGLRVRPEELQRNKSMANHKDPDD